MGAGVGGWTSRKQRVEYAFAQGDVRARQWMETMDRRSKGGPMSSLGLRRLWRFSEIRHWLLVEKGETAILR